MQWLQSVRPFPLSGRSISVLCSLSGTALFSSKTILIKLAFLHGVGVVELLSLRMLIALPCYLLVMGLLWRKTQLKPKMNLVLKAMGVGILGYYFASYLDLLGISMISAQLERLVLFTYPCFVVLFSWWFIGKRPSTKMWLSLALSYFGVAVLFGFDLSLSGEQVLLGSGLVLASAIAFAVYILLSKHLISKIGSIWFTCIAMQSAAIASLTHQHLSGGLEALFQQSAPVYAYGFAIAIFATVLPSFLISKALNDLGSAPVAVLGGIGPVVTAFLAVWVLGEHFGLIHAISTLLVICGAMLAVPKADK